MIFHRLSFHEYLQRGTPPECSSKTIANKQGVSFLPTHGCLAQSSAGIYFSLLLSSSSCKCIFVKRNSVPFGQQNNVMVPLVLQGVVTHTQTNLTKAL